MAHIQVFYNSIHTYLFEDIAFIVDNHSFKTNIFLKLVIVEDVNHNKVLVDIIVVPEDISVVQVNINLVSVVSFSFYISYTH